MKTSEAGAPARLTWLLGSLLMAQACADPPAAFTFGGYSYDQNRFIQWKLPKSLREISGLAMDDQQRLFAHDDEQAVIYQLDYRDGRLVKRFALGKPPVAGDFEGIAVARGHFYLITSDGDLYRAPEGDDGGWVKPQLTRTGLGARCEIEGMAFHGPENELLILCKTPRQASLQGYVTVFRWPLEGSDARAVQTIQLDLSALDPDRGLRRIHPSGIDISPRNGHLLIVAARERVLLEISPLGEMRGFTALPAEHDHPQAEGIAVTARGDLILADEGGSKKGRLGVYAAD